MSAQDGGCYWTEEPARPRVLASAGLVFIGQYQAPATKGPVGTTMQLDTLVRLTPIVPVVGVLLVVTGMWAPPERDAAEPGVGTGGPPSILLQIDVAPPTGRFT